MGGARGERKEKKGPFIVPSFEGGARASLVANCGPCYARLSGIRPLAGHTAATVCNTASVLFPLLPLVASSSDDGGK